MELDGWTMDGLWMDYGIGLGTHWVLLRLWNWNQVDCGAGWLDYRTLCSMRLLTMAWMVQTIIARIYYNKKRRLQESRSRNANLLLSAYCSIWVQKWATHLPLLIGNNVPDSELLTFTLKLRVSTPILNSRSHLSHSRQRSLIHRFDCDALWTALNSIGQ